MFLSSMSLRRRMRWINVAAAVVLTAVIAFTLTNLHDLQRTFVRYQEKSGVARLLIEVKAAALAASRIDPMPVESAERLRAADRKVEVLYEGDLRSRLPEGRDELGEVGARMNTFIGRFGEILGEVGNVSAEVERRASSAVRQFTWA